MVDQFTEGNEFLKTFLKDKDYIYLTSITHEFNEMLLNWHLSLKNINSSHLALAVCLDKNSYSYAQTHSIPSVYLECNIRSNLKGEEWIENEKQYKLLGLYIIFKHYNVDIVFSDVDVVFLKPPVEKLLQISQEEDWDWIAMSDRRFKSFVVNRNRHHDFCISSDKTEVTDTGPTAQALYGEENAGFSFIINPTSPSRLTPNSYEDKMYKIKFLENFQNNSELYKSAPIGNEEGCLQTLVNKKVKDTRLKVKILSSFEFPNGSFWEVPYLRKTIENSCYIVHYNFCEFIDPLQVKEEKIARMKKHGHWYVT